MSELCEKPLLTFVVATFNQERFVQEAVEAAFAQTYSPLEIVLSDDCSEDRTFQIMQDVASAYRGPHRLVLNRNHVRKSLGGHLNRIVELSHGEVIVGAAGDDVSLPHRTQVVYEAWEQSGRQATSIHSDITQIDENGRTIERIYQSASQGETGRFIEQPVKPWVYMETLAPIVFGCAHAFSPRLFRVFGNVPEEVIHEDNVLPFRSILAGRLLYISEPLVKYRVHGSNLYIKSKKRLVDLKSLERQEDRVRRDFRNRETMYETFLLDLDKARAQALIGSADFEKTLEEATRMRKHFMMLGEFLESGLVRKCRILSRLSREKLSKTERKMLVRRLIPRALLLRIRLARSCVALAWRRGE